LSIGAPGARCLEAAIAFAIGSDHADAGDDVDTGLVRVRVASRNASASPKNSVNATRNPVIAANRRNTAAGKPIHRCQRRHHAVFMQDVFYGGRLNGDHAVSPLVLGAIQTLIRFLDQQVPLECRIVCIL